MLSIRDNEGGTAFVSLIKMLLLLVVLGIGIEFYKFYTVKTMLVSKVHLSAQYALELSMNDNYRREHLSYVDEDDVEDYFYEMIRSELNLNRNLEPNDKSILKSRLEIVNLEVDEGVVSDNQTVYPKLLVEGRTKLPITLISFLVNREADVAFEIKAENKRYNE